MTNFGFSKLERPLPPFNDWTIDLETAGLLVDLIRKHRPGHVLECGSGVLTLLIAYAMLEYENAGRHFALDHSSRYAEGTQNLLAEHGMGRPRVLHAPLHGDPPWYTLTKLPIGYRFGEWAFDFVFIDGPPGIENRQSRRPAMENLWPMLSKNAVVLMDDAFRQDEIDAYEAWEKEYPVDVNVIHTARGAALITGKDSGHGQEKEAQTEGVLDADTKE